MKLGEGAVGRAAQQSEPLLVLAGSPKCGTTSVFHLLSGHPQIAPCRFKEAGFFLDPTDREVGKRTLAVRFGPRFARAEYVGLLGLAYALSASWAA